MQLRKNTIDAMQLLDEYLAERFAAQRRIMCMTAGVIAPRDSHSP